MSKNWRPLPNQELLGAKSLLQGETLGVCSSYKRGGQPPYNLPAAHLQFTGILPLPHYKQQYHRRPTVGVQENFPPTNYKHSYELWPTCRKIPIIVTYLEINYILSTSFYFFEKCVFPHVLCVFTYVIYARMLLNGRL